MKYNLLFVCLYFLLSVANILPQSLNPEATYTLTINSENPNSNVPMSFTPDVNGKSFGNTPTSAIYNSGTSVYVYVQTVWAKMY